MKNKGSKAGAWISAMRLRTLPLSFSVIIMGSAMAYVPPGVEGFCDMVAYDFQWSIFWLTILTTLFLQILSNLANDYGDALKGTDNDNRVGPERAIQSGKISAKSMKTGIIFTAFLSLISGLFLLFAAFGTKIDLLFIVFLLLGLLSIAAAIKYTVGNKAYGYRALGDLFVFIFFGLVGVVGSYYLQAHNGFSLIIIFPAITIGCFCVMVLNLNNMRDTINDKAVGKITVAVKLGFKGAKYYHYFLMLLAWSSPALLFTNPNTYPLVLLLLPVLIIHIIHLRKVIRTKDPKEFDPELKKIALSSFLFSILCWVILMMIN